jgi:hypothetical protein
MKENTQNSLQGFVRLGGTPAEVASKLGPLADLEGTWKGASGWNLIAVPSRSNGTPEFTLLIQNYSETITFTPISAPVPNRGGAKQQFITGLLYELVINDLQYPNGVLHIENGMWLNMADIEAQPDGPVTNAIRTEQYTIVRQSSIPHGDVVVALGGSVQSTGAPTFPVLNAIPSDIGTRPDGYTDVYLNNSFHLETSNMNTKLAEAIAGQQIGKVTALIVDTGNLGGNISNIPFVERHVFPSRFSSTFWIEEVLTDSLNFMQLQYSQQTDLNFLLKDPNNPADGVIMWPHASVNTLRKI